MAIFKCKICGGSLNVKQGERVTECEYCGVKQTLPNFIEPKVQEMYDRANNYLMHNEFDKAENLYNQILFENKEDADAYWNVLMCRYGVTYVKDPSSGKYIPTCNRTLYTPIFNDENYQNALKYADEKQKALYIENAQTIDNVQKGILAVSKKEKPFDVFISYKETNANGARTKDSIVAQDLYDKLTAEGYKVFFSRITLEDKAGTEYEPYIYAALASSKVMITVSSSKENLEAVWVKNEWSRFLSFAGKDSSKTLIPLYFDMDKDELPDDFAHLSAYDMKVDGFEQELIRGIKKLIPLPVMLLEQRKKRNKLLKRVGLVAAACVVIGAICAIPWFMKLPEYNAAMQLYYDKNYPEATWAFDAMGGYRNSEEMKERCALSWRKSLAQTVCTDVLDNTIANFYISQNGNVEELSFYVKNREYKDDSMHINEHGKIISLSAGTEVMYLLYEDGYVGNSAQNNKMTSDWTDIIQISPIFGNTSIALNIEGKIVFGDITNEWLLDVAKWTDIIAFDYARADGFQNSIIIGIKSDGSLCGVGDDEIVHLEKILSNFSQVKSLDVSFDYDSEELNIIAITKNNTLQVYRNNEFEEFSDTDIVSIERNLDNWGSSNPVSTYILYKNGILYKNNDIICDNVLYLTKDHYITKDGSVFIYSGSPKMIAKNSIVYDEWIERVN